MTTESMHGSDAALIDLLRGENPCAIGEMAAALGVTATAIRQRLDRLIRAGIVEKLPHDASSGQRSRGRPANAYALTEKGRQIGGDNFRDLALVLWREIREVRDPSVRRGLFNRIGESLADLYRGAVSGDSSSERLESIARVLRERQIPCGVGADASGGLAVLTSHACPYPELAAVDRGICASERQMLENLVGAPVRLSECRLDGDACCRFTVETVSKTAARASAEGLAPNALSASNPC